MGYREALKRGGGYTESQLNDVCVSIATETDIYDLAFIEFETRDLLGIQVTRSDFTEGFVIINKKYIVSIGIVYAGDIVFDTSTKDNNVSYI